MKVRVAVEDFIDPGYVGTLYTSDDYIDLPALAYANGVFGVAWKEFGGESNRVRAMRFDAQLAALDEEPLLVTNDTGWGEHAAIAAGDDDFLVVWDRDDGNGNSSIVARRLEADELWELSPSGLHWFPAATATNDGFVVTWVSEDDDQVLGVELTPEGVASELMSLGEKDDASQELDVVALDTGFLSLFEQRFTGWGGAGLDVQATLVAEESSTLTVSAQRVFSRSATRPWPRTARGTCSSGKSRACSGRSSRRASPRTEASSTPSPSPSARASASTPLPAAAAIGDDYLVVWQSELTDTELRLRSVSAEGLPGSEIKLPTNGSALRPDIAAIADRALVVWHQYDTDTGWDVRGIVVNAARRGGGPALCHLERPRDAGLRQRRQRRRGLLRGVARRARR